LIQPAADGAYHVIGGTGGKLNYLKLKRDSLKHEDGAPADTTRS
jgi:hypothetical protein